MDINRLNSVMEVLRRQVDETDRRTGSVGAERQHTPDGTRTFSAGSRASLARIRQRIQERLQKIPPTDPERSQRSRRIFVESILAWEFGEQVLADPRFDDLIQQVQSALASHEDLDRQLAEFLSSL